jgi:hypothetical protein
MENIPLLELVLNSDWSPSAPGNCREPGLSVNTGARSSSNWLTEAQPIICIPSLGCTYWVIIKVDCDVLYVLFHWRPLRPSCRRPSATQTLRSRAARPARRSSPGKTQSALCGVLPRRPWGGTERQWRGTVWPVMVSSRHTSFIHRNFCLGGSRCCSHRVYMCGRRTNL